MRKQILKKKNKEDGGEPGLPAKQGTPTRSRPIVDTARLLLDPRCWPQSLALTEIL